MTSLTAPAFVAVIVGCLVAVAAFVPFVAISYRRRGGLTFWRTLSWLGAAIYAMALWTYTLLPLPAANDIVCSRIQLTPFQFIADIASFDTGSLGALARNPAVMQVTLNVVLFMPLGWFVRQLGGRGVVIAGLSGLAGSLLIEFTQITGIWGLYQCAYRVFDVDDLLMNTLGAVVGSLIALLVLGHSGQLGRVPDAAAPRPITAVRRFTGIACDLMLMWIATWVVFVGSAVFVWFVRMSVGAENPGLLGASSGGGGGSGAGAGAAGSGGSGLAGSGAGSAGYSSTLSIDVPDVWITILAYGAPLLIQLISVMTGGVTVGERIVMLRSTTTSMPVPVSRLMRFLFGIGGYTLLTAATWSPTGLILGFLVLVTFIMVFTTRDHRGLACVVAGMELKDAREE